MENPGVVQEYIQNEKAFGRIIGPLKKSPATSLQVSPFGVIPKQHAPSQWRLIVDLSHPEGHSVNDGIDSSLSSLFYVSVDNLTEVVVKLGRETQLAKMDIKSAYRVVPVYPARGQTTIRHSMERASLWTWCSLLVSTEHPKYLMQWLMLYSG